MKRKFLVSLSALSLVMLLSISSANAQTSLGAFLAFGTEIETLGIGVNGEFYVTDAITIAPDIIYFFPNTTEFPGSGEIKSKLFEINANGHYHFDLGSSVMPYALVGIGIAIVGVEAFGFDDSTTDIGLNLGGGADFDIGSSIMPFGEIRYATNTSQLVIMGGVRLPLN